MGCWNGTCFISRLPIKSGDDVKVLFMRDRRGATDIQGLCYASDDYGPLGLPFEAQYNDYGGFENVKDSPSNQSNIDFLFKAIGEHCPKDLKAIGDLAERGEIEDRDGKKIRFVMAHKSVWDKSTEMMRDIFVYSDSEYIKLEESIKPLFDKKDRVYRQFGTNNYIEILDKLSKRAKSGESLEEIDLDISCEHPLFDFRWEIPRYNPKLRNNFIELLLLQSFMSHTRLSFHETAGSGSQSSGLDIYKRFYQYMVDICEDILTNEEKEYGDREDSFSCKPNS